MRYRLLFLTLLLLLAGGVTAGEMTATTEDGRKVILRSNGTWVLADDATTDTGREAAVLQLERRFDIARGCRLGLRLQNDLDDQIRTLVLRFTAYKGDDIPFETVSRGFSYLKPTTSQYQEITFRGIKCEEISSVEVFAARNCHVGRLTKYSASANHCLELIDVAPSDLLAIAKRMDTR